MLRLGNVFFLLELNFTEMENIKHMLFQHDGGTPLLIKKILSSSYFKKRLCELATLII